MDRKGFQKDIQQFSFILYVYFNIAQGVFLVCFAHFPHCIISTLHLVGRENKIYKSKQISLQ